jgi:peroxiredoxin
MNKRYAILLLIFISSFSISQTISVKITGASGKVVLLKLEGENTSEVDIINLSKQDFQFSLKDKSIGFYRLHFDNNHWFDFIHDGKSIKIHTDYRNLLDSLEIIESESNSILYNFLDLNKNYKTKTQLLQLILSRYPKDDNYYSISQKKLIEINKEYLFFIDSASRNNPNSFVSRYIRSAQLPVVPDSIKIENQLPYLKSYSLKNLDFNDAELIYSDTFTKKTIEYLTYYRNPQLPKELLEKEFMKAVDTLLNKAKINQLIYQHVTEYLIDGFKKFGFDKIIDYIVENYVIKDDLCLDEKTENSIQKRIDQSKMLSLGTEAPNILVPDINGKVFDLLKLQSNNTLLVFYSSECSHCQTLLPRLNELQKERKEIKIVAISLDTKKKDWIKFVEDNQLNLLNINDPNGWSGTTASDYYIYATPTMFLLNKDNIIVGKPTSYTELADLL